MLTKQAIFELERWLASLDVRRFPTEAEIDLWELWLDLARVEQQLHDERRQIPVEGGALDLFAAQDSCGGRLVG